MALKPEQKNEEFYIEHALKIVPEISRKFKTISVYSTNEDMLRAQNSISVKKLIKDYGYKI